MRRILSKAWRLVPSVQKMAVDVEQRATVAQFADHVAIPDLVDQRLWCGMSGHHAVRLRNTTRCGTTPAHSMAGKIDSFAQLVADFTGQVNCRVHEPRKAKHDIRVALRARYAQPLHFARSMHPFRRQTRHGSRVFVEIVVGAQAGGANDRMRAHAAKILTDTNAHRCRRR
jgi:hypothetical protein